MTTMIRTMANGRAIKDMEEEFIRMLRRVNDLRRRCFDEFSSLDAQFAGLWNNGQRQGPGEMIFGQYKYVGKFSENYVCFPQ